MIAMLRSRLPGGLPAPHPGLPHRGPGPGKVPDATAHRLSETGRGSLKQAIPDGLEEIQTLAKTLISRSQDVLAYFDRPRTLTAPRQAINGRLEHLRGIALGFRFRNLAHYTIRNLIHTGRLKDHLTTTT